ncbi:glycosyltransferase family 39 protein [Ilyomonas limi]|uniref:Glycosyltransferase family 39 protein n=1 Tax=Ilyomonas limi TaxID=2575867 RepID=A0A4U3KV93_9BACT|nr:glycosyltransferase family 39 protein [Ilyomonas limi]TKK66388.1 glycosyltransferase family 39 protein [Ilyomonas limi]
MKNYNKLLYALALLRLVLPYLLQNPVYEPHRDEFLYLAEGNHVAWGFMEVPPMLSIFAWLTHLLGGGMFWIKLWPSLFGAATFIVAGKIVLSQGGRSFALWLLFLSFTFSVYLRLFFLFQPNPPEVFFWTMMVYSIIRYIQTGKNRWLYVFGVAVGLGMLSKYSVAFYTVSLLAGVLLTKYRTIFISKHFWLAALAGFIIFLPNLLWQYHHQFPVFHHMRELQQTQLQYISPLSFLSDQLLMFAPCFFVWLAGLYYVFFSRNEKRFRFAGWAYVFVIIILLIGRGKNYYALGAYPVLLAFGAYYLEHITIAKKMWRYIMMVPIFILGFVFLPLLLPIYEPAKLAAFYQKMGINKTGLLKWEDLKNHPLPQDFSDMLGWEEMTKKVAAAYRSLSPAEQQQTLIFCNNYGMAGAVNYYGRKYGLPEAYSDNASFLYWLPENKPMTNLILVTEDTDELAHDYIRFFKSAQFTDSVTNVYAREYGDFIMLAKGADERFTRFFHQKIAEDKAEMK